MKFNRTHTLKEIAEIIEVKFIGDESFPIEGLNEIHRVDKGEIVFVDHPKYYKKAIESKATVILINKEIDCPEGKALLISDNPFRDFIKLGQHFSLFTNSIKPISDSSIIGEKTIIQPNVFIGNYVTIGKNCIIHANASIFDHTSIGDNVIIGSGTVIGGDAFYYKKTENGYEKLKSVGKVIIEDEVEIGTNCTIDRGVTSATIIKKGSKLDNLIQIGHDTIIGERCLIASQSGIAGCCTIENEVVIWGQVGISSGLTIGEKVVITAQSGVSKSLKGGFIYSGKPAVEFSIYSKRIAKLNIILKNNDLNKIK